MSSPSSSIDDLSRSSVHFVPLPPDREAASSPFLSSSARRSSSPSPPLPGLYQSYCGTRRRVYRCCALVFIVLALAGVGFALNFVFRPTRPPALDICGDWVNTFHITPDASSNCPSVALQVTYAGRDVPFASTLPTNFTQHLPSLVLSSSFSSDHVFALFILDVDFPSASNYSYRSRTHSIILNIPPVPAYTPLNLSRGNTVFPYTPLCPYPTYGVQRYAVLLYDTGAALKAPNSSQVPSVRMNAEYFLAVLGNADYSGRLVAGSFFFAEFDSLCNYSLPSQ